ncbi:MAG: hypothetical protein KA436_12440 [Oligoflexales bacterium]|nr:hypothetical protein [Oligoflexales bacterium]
MRILGSLVLIIVMLNPSPAYSSVLRYVMGGGLGFAIGLVGVGTTIALNDRPAKATPECAKNDTPLCCHGAPTITNDTLSQTCSPVDLTNCSDGHPVCINSTNIYPSRWNIPSNDLNLMACLVSLTIMLSSPVLAYHYAVLAKQAQKARTFPSRDNQRLLEFHASTL